MIRTSILVWMVDDTAAGQEVASILNHTVDIRCKKVCTDCDELNQAIEQTDNSGWPDVVVFNGCNEGAQRIRQFKKLAPHIKCLLKIDHNFVEKGDAGFLEGQVVSRWIGAIQNGASAVLWGEGIGPLVSCIRETSYGGQWMPTSVAIALQPALAATTEGEENPFGLSLLGNEVYAGMVAGLSREASMSSIGLTPTGIGECIQELYGKIHRLEGVV